MHALGAPASTARPCGPRSPTLALCSSSFPRAVKPGMKRVDTFGFFTLLAAGVPLFRAWRLRGRRLTPFAGSLVRSALVQRQWRRQGFVSFSVPPQLPPRAAFHRARLGRLRWAASAEA